MLWERTSVTTCVTMGADTVSLRLHYEDVVKDLLWPINRDYFFL